MDLTVRKYKSLDEMKADEYRYWQSRPVWERMFQDYKDLCPHSMPMALDI